ncbi:MAG: cytochrome c oxidase subunit 3 [Bacteroidota bacterium]
MGNIEAADPGKKVSKIGIALLMLSVIVLFSTLGAAFMRSRQGEQVALPFLFYANTLILLISSVLLHFSWKSEQLDVKKGLLSYSLLLGLAFLVSQTFAWGQLYAEGIDIALSGQKASYLYVLTGLHALHVIGGNGFLAFVYFAFEKRGKDYFESAMFFWHFLGLLWVYLLCLLLV